jgi:mannosyltransferase
MHQVTEDNLPSESRLTVIDLLIALTIPFLVAMLSFSTKSFWGDEIHSINFSSGNLVELFQSLASDYHPPLYFLLLKAWITIWGTAEVGLRIFQGIQGSLLILVSLLLFRKMLPQTRYPVFWILFITSSELWLFMPMLRYYTLAASFVVLSTLLFFRWMETRNRNTGVLLGISYVLVLYTDYPISCSVCSMEASRPYRATHTSQSLCSALLLAVDGCRHKTDWHSYRFASCC